MCVVELTKILMSEFLYDYIKSKYDNKAKLLLTDTDSLIKNIRKLIWMLHNVISFCSFL